MSVHFFAGEVRQEGLSRAERNWARQAMGPDIRIIMPAVGHSRGWAGIGGDSGRAEATGERVGEPGGAALASQESQVLHELKVIGCNWTKYKHTRNERVQMGLQQQQERASI